MTGGGFGRFIYQYQELTHFRRRTFSPEWSWDPIRKSFNDPFDMPLSAVQSKPLAANKNFCAIRHRSRT